MGNLGNIAVIIILNLLVYWKSLKYGFVGDDIERSQRKDPLLINDEVYLKRQTPVPNSNPPQILHEQEMIKITECCKCRSLTAFGRLFEDSAGFFKPKNIKLSNLETRETICVDCETQNPSRILALSRWIKNRVFNAWIQFIGLRYRSAKVAHSMTLGVHTVCCVAIYLALGCNDLSLLTAILFAVNPINIQGSIWISGRNYATATICILAMWALPKLSWIFYGVSGFFGVNGWFSPLVFLGTPHWYMVGILPIVWLLMPHNKSTLHRKLWETGGLKTTNTEMRAVKLSKIIPFVKTYMYYFVLALFPHTIAIEHNFIRGFGTNKTDNEKGYKIDRFFWTGFVMFSTVSIISLWCIFNGWTPLTWGLFWFTVNIAMWSNFVTYQQHISERYVYLANVGMMYALASVAINYPILAGVFVVGYIVRLRYIMDMYLNDYWTVEYSLTEAKNMHYIWLMRGVKKFAIKDYMGALYDFNEAYQHKPYDLKVLYDLAVVNLLVGNLPASKDFLKKARENVYDELSDVVQPAFDSLEKQIKLVEESQARGEKGINIDLKNIMVVK